MNRLYKDAHVASSAKASLWADYFLSAASEHGQWLYMLVDAAHDKRILPALEKSLHTRACLFSEDHVSVEIKAVSPFLLKIKTVDEFVTWCLQEGMHQHWFIFFTSPEIHVSEMKLHFKRFSFAYGPDGEQYFFRYYDPRVLPIFLIEGDGRDRTEFFRRCKTVWIPQVSSDGKVYFSQIDAQCTPIDIRNPVRTLA